MDSVELKEVRRLTLLEYNPHFEIDSVDF